MCKYGVFSGPYFPAFGLNTERYSVSLRIQSECGKIRTRKDSVFGHFSRSDVLSSSDTAGKNSVPKISKNSVKQNTAEEGTSQENVSKIPINYNLSFNNDANDDKQTA